MKNARLLLCVAILGALAGPVLATVIEFDEVPLQPSASSIRKADAIKRIVIGGIFLLLALFALRRVLARRWTVDAPGWQDLMPSHLKPESRVSRQLEDVRSRYGIEHPVFSIHIAGHPATTRRLQHQLYQDLRRQNPDYNNQKILSNLIRSRWESLNLAGRDLFGLKELHGEMREQRIQEIARDAGTNDGLVDLFVREEQRQSPPLQSMFVSMSASYFAEVDRILGEKSIK